MPARTATANRPRLWLRGFLGAFLGLLAGVLAAVAFMGFGLAIGWVFVFGDGNGREVWFMPLLTIVGALVIGVGSGAGCWLALPPASRSGRLFLVVTVLVWVVMGTGMLLGT